MVARGEPCDSPWEALRGDVLPWLLQGERPSFHWRVLVDLIGRPDDSPAVRRAAGAANVDDPVAALLAELLPDGTWGNGCGWWTRWRGNGWRVLAAVALGADRQDPRLRAACDVLLAEAPGDGGLARRPGQPPDAALTARAVAAMLAFGGARQPRVQEALAWLEEGAPASREGGWATAAGDECAVTPCAVLEGLIAVPNARGAGLLERARAAVVRVLAGPRRRAFERCGHPRLVSTDLAEMLSVLARVRAPWDPVLRPALGRLQELADDHGHWPRRRAVPASLPVGMWRPGIGAASRWVTLGAVVAILRYAVEAELPRLFPPKPSTL